MPARYLLRFDDICESMDWTAWHRIEPILQRTGVRPLLAVVPDNRDASLAVNPPNPDFWAKVKEWRAYGWTIGMHGYRHEYVNRNPGLLGLNSFSEFAGLSYTEQFGKLEASLSAFRRHEVEPEVWVAPGHSFDLNTVRALTKLGICAISDGYALWPYSDAEGTFWLPQQLWRFHSMPTGIWTVCFHINGWNEKETATFEKTLTRFLDQVVDFDGIRTEFASRSRSVVDRAFDASFRLILQWRRTTSMTTDH